jgi:hypothetical protein
MCCRDTGRDDDATKGIRKRGKVTGKRMVTDWNSPAIHERY